MSLQIYDLVKLKHYKLRMHIFMLINSKNDIKLSILKCKKKGKFCAILIQGLIAEIFHFYRTGYSSDFTNKSLMKNKNIIMDFILYNT